MALAADSNTCHDDDNQDDNKHSTQCNESSRLTTISDHRKQTSSTSIQASSTKLSDCKLSGLDLGTSHSPKLEKTQQTSPEIKQQLVHPNQSSRHQQQLGAPDKTSQIESGLSATIKTTTKLTTEHRHNQQQPHTEIEIVEEKSKCNLRDSVSLSEVVDQASSSKKQSDKPEVGAEKVEEALRRSDQVVSEQTNSSQQKPSPLGTKWLDVILSGVRQNKQQTTRSKDIKTTSAINKIDNKHQSSEQNSKVIKDEQEGDKGEKVESDQASGKTHNPRNQTASRVQTKSTSNYPNILNHNLFGASPTSPPVPSFGDSPIKLNRLPYYTYQGRAKNITLISAADRFANRHINLINSSFHSSNSSIDSSSSTWESPFGCFNKPPSEATQPNSKRQYLIRKQQQLRTRGYSNISNIFPDKPMLRGRRRAATKSADDFKELSQTRPINIQQNQNNNHNNNNKQTVGSRSLLNLNELTHERVKSKPPPFNNYTGNSRQSITVTPMRRHNSLLGGQGGVSGPSTGRDGGAIAASGNIGAKTTVAAPVSARPASVSGNYGLAGSRTHQGSHHRRSPSAGSLHYGGYGGGSGPENGHNVGYGRDQDPDCPVHGLSAYELDKSGGGELNNSPGQVLDAESPYGYPLYGSRRRGPGHYESRQVAGGLGSGGERMGGRGPTYASAYSLYSPTSPIEARPAYYDRESRFSVYQSAGGNQLHRDRSDSGYKSSGVIGPAVGGVRSSLAPPKEQLRRILGYQTQPASKPVHLHPQWAYSRPFHHLLPSGAEWTPPSPVGNDPLDGGLFIDYDNDINQLNASLLRFSPFNKLEDTQAIRAVDFHPSGQVYAIGSNSRALRICAYPAPSELNSFGVSLLAGGQTAGAESPVGSPLTNPGHHQYHSNAPQSPRVLFKFLQVHRGSIYCVRFNKTGQLLATGSNDQTVHIVRYNSRTHSPEGDEYRLTMHDGTVRDLCFIDDSTSGNSLLISAGGGDNKIYVTDCDTITPFQSFAGHTGMVMGLHHLGGAQFVSGSQDRTIRFWDLRTRQCTSIVSAPPARPGTRWGAGGPGAPVCAVQADHSGRLLVSGHTDSTCMLYDIRGGRIIQAFKPHEDEIRTVSFSPKSYYLLTGAYDGRIVLSDLQGDLNQTLPSVCVAESDDKIIQSRWHPTDFTFVTTSANKTATLWVPPTDGL